MSRPVDRTTVHKKRDSRIRSPSPSTPAVRLSALWGATREPRRRREHLWLPRPRIEVAAAPTTPTRLPVQRSAGPPVTQIFYVSKRNTRSQWTQTRSLGETRPAGARAIRTVRLTEPDSRRTVRVKVRFPSCDWPSRPLATTVLCSDWTSRVYWFPTARQNAAAGIRFQFSPIRYCAVHTRISLFSS